MLYSQRGPLHWYLREREEGRIRRGLEHWQSLLLHRRHGNIGSGRAIRFVVLWLLWHGWCQDLERGRLATHLMEYQGGLVLYGRDQYGLCFTDLIRFAHHLLRIRTLRIMHP